MPTAEEIRAMDAPPIDNPWVAGAWIALRHPWAEHLMRRVEAIDEETGLPDVDELAETLREHDEHKRVWAVYEDRNPVPTSDDDADSAFYGWKAKGPQATPRSRSFGVLSGGEKDCLRVMAMLGREGSLVTPGLFDAGDSRRGAIVAAVLDVFSRQVEARRSAAERADGFFTRPGDARPF